MLIELKLRRIFSITTFSEFQLVVVGSFGQLLKKQENLVETVN